MPLLRHCRRISLLLAAAEIIIFADADADAEIIFAPPPQAAAPPPAATPATAR